ncbi:MAG TPA: rhodanese-like domain-containing protein [Pseudobdellovibrionaceae bacterium]|jgi:rhodanese-related sulfurtransferase
MAQSIGFFQFDNLVKSRIGFIFINLGVDTSALYHHMEKSHLENTLLRLPEGELANVSTATIVAALANQAKDSAVIVLSPDGVTSLEVATALEKAGFLNVFDVKGGWKQILADQD